MGIVLIPTAGIGIAAAIDFNSVFVQFHNIFFDNDLWLFDPAEDFMIRMLPKVFFMIWHSESEAYLPGFL